MTDTTVTRESTCKCQDCMSQWCAYCMQQCVLSYKGSCSAYYSKKKKYENSYVSHSASSAEMLQNPSLSLPTCPPDALKPLHSPAHLFSLSSLVPHYTWQPFVPLPVHSTCHVVCTLRHLKPKPCRFTWTCTISASLSSGQPVSACICIPANTCLEAHSCAINHWTAPVWLFLLNLGNIPAEQNRTCMSKSNISLYICALR